MQSLRNVAIIAHVDHGKTTLVDTLFRQSGTFRDNQKVDERAMDSNDLEKERGITILAKCTSIEWQDTRINIVDTPGHADFGAEVERILNMVDGVILLVDAAEGPLPQTKFVLSKALKLNLAPIVVVNKVDRPDGRPQEVLDEVYELFMNLGATDEQIDFPVLYASGRNGWADTSLDGPRKDLSPLFETILNTVPAPAVNVDAPFSMLVTTLAQDNFLGRILTGRITSGSIKVNQEVKVLNLKNEKVESARVAKILAYRGLDRTALDYAQAGDIVALAGISKGTVSDTICDTSVSEAIVAHPIDPPTLAMTFSINDSPFAGKSGTKLTSRMVHDRLIKEAEGNISIKVTQSKDKDAFEVAGRGELQLGILIENMRREGYELSISRPRVLFQEENGKKLEPIEEIVIEVDDEFSGAVIEAMNDRKADMTNMQSTTGGKTKIEFLAPTRGLIGFHGQFLTMTRGTGVMNRLFNSYAPYKGEILTRHRGVLISNSQGVATAYSLVGLEERGELFVGNGDPVYQGMIIGENSRENDLEVNPTKAKQLTNIRASGKDETIRLAPPRIMTLEKAMSYIADDERLEVTPTDIRIRKALLDPNDRKRASRNA